jgi:hypothetical protein
VERDVAFATIPGTGRKLLADIWQAPHGVSPSGLAVVYLRGGGYVAFDKDRGGLVRMTLDESGKPASSFLLLAVCYDWGLESGFC